VILLTLCLFAAVAAPAVADPTADVRAMHEAFIAAAHAKDAAAAKRLYADDVVVMWEYGDEAYGRKEIDALIDSAFDSMKDLHLVLKDVQGKALGADRLTSSGHWQVTYTAADGKLVTMSLRSTENLVKRNGRWQYQMQHVSAPLPPEEAATTK
jgi:uncharacterized protein (TIGR02246 family)